MPSPRENHLSDRDRQALTVARDLRERMQAWMSRRGVAGTLVISPFVDPSGKPSVLIRIDTYVARAMVLSFDEQRPMEG